MAFNAFPGEWIRTSYGVYWEKQLKKDVTNSPPLQTDYEVRYCAELNCYTDVTTISTSTATYNTAANLFKLASVTVWLPDTATGLNVPIIYSGPWFVTSFVANDNGNGTTRVTLQLQAQANWQPYSTAVGP